MITAMRQLMNEEKTGDELQRLPPVITVTLHKLVAVLAQGHYFTFLI